MRPQKVGFSRMAVSFFPYEGAHVINLDTLTPTTGASKKDITLHLNGRDWTLRMSLFSLMKLEEKTGENLAQNNGLIRYLDRSKASFTSTVELLWALMLTDEPELKLDDVARWIDINELVSIQRMTEQAVEESLPVIEPSELGNENEPTPLRRKKS